MGQPRRCIFCAAPADSREHFWPDWIIERVKPSKHSAFKFNVQGREFISRNRDLVVRCVCDSCNKGWMSKLESLVVPPVGCMIQDISTPLDNIQQSQIARWSVKSSMVMERIGRAKRTPFYTDDERSRLRLNSAIPPRTMVWLARYGGVDDIACLGTDIWNDVPDGPGTIHGYVNNIVAGRLAVQVLTLHPPGRYDNRTIVVHPNIGRFDAHVIQIWPFQTSKVWPPVPTITAADSDSFARRFSGGGTLAL